MHIHTEFGGFKSKCKPHKFCKIYDRQVHPFTAFLHEILFGIELGKACRTHHCHGISKFLDLQYLLAGECDRIRRIVCVAQVAAAADHLCLIVHTVGTQCFDEKIKLCRVVRIIKMYG